MSWNRTQTGKDRWRWRLSHLFWGLFTLFMMGWAFLLGLLVGQGSLATPEQVASLKNFAKVIPGMPDLAPEEAPPPPVEQRLQQPELTFYDDVERKEGPPLPEAKATAKPGAPAPAPAPVAAEHPAQTAAGAAPTAPPAPGAPPVPPPTPPTPPTPKPAPPVLGKPMPFQPETAPPIDLTVPPPTAKPHAAPAPAATPAPAHQPQPFRPQGSPPQMASAGLPAATANSRRGLPIPPPAAPRKGRFIVQVASFQEEQQARDLMAQLKNAGHPAFLVRTQLEGVGPRFRVRVGPYEELDQAQGAAGRIRIQLSLAAFVTREDQP